MAKNKCINNVRAKVKISILRFKYNFDFWETLRMSTLSLTRKRKFFKIHKKIFT